MGHIEELKLSEYYVVFLDGEVELSVITPEMRETMADLPEEVHESVIASMIGAVE